MVKVRILLVVVTVALIFLLYNLPKVVVENDEGTIAEDNSENNSVTSQMDDNAVGFLSESSTFTSTQQASISNLRQNFFSSTNTEKSTIFADSLATLYAMKGDYDSAVWFAEQIVPSSDWQENYKAGEIYYQAFENSRNAENAEEYSQQAQQYLEKALEVNPELTEARIRLAMIYVSSPNPMQGVTMLREVLQENPENEEALYYMGMLSVQSGQYDRALERFHKLVEIDSDNHQARYLLGLSYINTGQIDEAKKQLEQLTALDNNSEIVTAAQNLLDEMKE